MAYVAGVAARTAAQSVRVNDATKICVATNNAIDCIITDPPYCILFRRQKDGSAKSKPASSRSRPTFPDRFDTVKAFVNFTSLWVDVQIGSLKHDGKLIVWMNRLGKQHVVSICQSKGFHVLGEYLWAKAPSLPSPNSTANEVNLRVYESALVFSRDRNAAPAGLGDGAAHLPIPWSVITGYHEGLPSLHTSRDSHEHKNGESARPRVVAGSASQDGELSPPMHPHHKPFACLDPLIRTWTRPGDLVYDPFAGSGAILAAAARLGRRVVGGELDPQWVAVASQYVEQSALEYDKMR